MSYNELITDREQFGYNVEYLTVCAWWAFKYFPVGQYRQAKECAIYLNKYYDTRVISTFSQKIYFSSHRELTEAAKNAD